MHKHSCRFLHYHSHSEACGSRSRSRSRWRVLFRLWSHWHDLPRWTWLWVNVLSQVVGPLCMDTQGSSSSWIHCHSVELVTLVIDCHGHDLWAQSLTVMPGLRRFNSRKQCRFFSSLKWGVWEQITRKKPWIPKFPQGSVALRLLFIIACHVTSKGSVFVTQPGPVAPIRPACCFDFATAAHSATGPGETRRWRFNWFFSHWTLKAFMTQTPWLSLLVLPENCRHCYKLLWSIFCLTWLPWLQILTSWRTASASRAALTNFK